MNGRESLTSTNQPLVAKILIIGDTRVGKSCILARFAENYYNPNTTITVGIDCKTKKIQVDDTTIKMQIWDTAGQEKYKSITQNFYKNAMGVMIVFDLTNRSSFENVRKWIGQVKNTSREDVCMLLIGNKCDDVEYRMVSQQEIIDLVNEIGINYTEASAKEDINIKEMFEKMARDIKDSSLKDSQLNNASFKEMPNIRRVLTAPIVQQKGDSGYSRCC